MISFLKENGWAAVLGWCMGSCDTFHITDWHCWAFLITITTLVYVAKHEYHINKLKQ